MKTNNTTAKKYNLSEAIGFQVGYLGRKSEVAKEHLMANFEVNFKYYVRDILTTDMALDRYKDILEATSDEEMIKRINYFQSESNRKIQTMSLNNSTCIFANAQTQVEFEFHRSFATELQQIKRAFEKSNWEN
jgi:hypothetical protein